ncbi:MAG: hypothetical protein D6736_12090 [Nitrospinota bacterium]|nr:MAG: hypothetical protein D6736_12090 [Nitrospinota bacterium]
MMGIVIPIRNVRGSGTLFDTVAVKSNRRARCGRGDLSGKKSCSSLYPGKCCGDLFTELRRNTRPPKGGLTMIYRFEDYELDTRLYELRHHGQPLKLEPQVFNLLLYLIQHWDRVVSREELLDYLWPDRFVSEGILSQRLMAARRAIGDSGREQRLIQTVHGRGYRFIGRVEEEAAPSPDHTVQAGLAPPSTLETPGSDLTIPEPLSSPASLDPSLPFSFSLSDQIRTSWTALEGERKYVTVVLCTVANAAAIAEQVSPEVLHTLLHRFFELALHEVQRYEGIITQFLGNGIMALFGVPFAEEEHARQAVQGALGIQRGIEQSLTPLGQQHGTGLAVQIGVHTGLVIVGTLEEGERVTYTAVGDTLTLLTHLHQLTTPGMILLTEQTWKLVAGYFQCTEAGLVETGGDAAPVRVYRVIGEQGARSRFDVAREQGLTCFVGREQELALLQRCLDRAVSGQGQSVGIVGEPGLGKSRLLYEFRHFVAQQEYRWLEGYCLPQGKRIPYSPVLEKLHTGFQIEENDHPHQIREKLRQGIHLLDPELERTVPFLEALFGLPGTDEALRHLDPKERRQQTLAALQALIFALCRRQPLVLVCENLHWIDQSSEDCLAMLIESLASMPVLILTTHRPGYRVRWADNPSYTQIALHLFSQAETASMVTDLLGSQELPPGLLPFIQERTGGNPLFIEEVIQSLLEQGRLVRHPGGIRWRDEVGTDFPATMQDIIRARLDRLDRPVKRTIQVAAVIGREFDLPLLTPFSENPAELRYSLETLKHLDLIHETHVFPQPSYRFKHAVIQDVAYQSLFEQQRQELHGAIGLVLEQSLSAQQQEEQAAMLTYHYTRSRYPEKAIAYSLLTGDRAARLYASTEASAYYAQALTRAQALPPSPEAYRFQIDATLKLASVGTTREEFERSRAALDQAQHYAEALCDEARWAQVLYWLGRMSHVLGDPVAAITYARQSLEIADRLEDEALAAPPVNLMGRAYWFRSDFVQAAQMLTRSAEQMHRLGNTGEEATASGFAGLALGHLGEFARAFPYLDRGIRLSQEIQHPLAEAAAYHYRAMIYDQQGEWSAVIRDCERARQIAAEKGDLVRVYLVKIVEGRAYTMRGEPERGREILEEGLALAEQLGIRLVLAWLKTNLAACLGRLGLFAAALPLCQDALTLAQATDDRYAQALAYRILAKTLFGLDPADAQRANHYFQEAFRIQKEIGTAPELGRSYVSYASLLQSQGESDRAREYLVQARELFRQMGMTWDQGQAEQLLAAIA